LRGVLKSAGDNAAGCLDGVAKLGDDRVMKDPTEAPKDDLQDHLP